MMYREVSCQRIKREREREIETKKREIRQIDLLCPCSERRAARRAADGGKKESEKLCERGSGERKNQKCTYTKKREIRQMD